MKYLGFLPRAKARAFGSLAFDLKYVNWRLNSSEDASDAEDLLEEHDEFVHVNM